MTNSEKKKIVLLDEENDSHQKPSWMKNVVP
jgi:hypothetical protein